MYVYYMYCTLHIHVHVQYNMVHNNYNYHDIFFIGVSYRWPWITLVGDHYDNLSPLLIESGDGGAGVERTIRGKSFGVGKIE